jgi:predicted GIY-YIG superfamily endonuclease
MCCVYILKSLKIKDKFYVGITENLDRRMQEHSNPKKDQYTYRHAPWKLETYVVFNDIPLAKSFELYLKTGSGRIFLRKHLV